MTAAFRTQQISEAMSRRGLNLRQVAKRTGYAYGTVRNTACGVSRSRAVRLAIEEALGGITIWGAAKEATPIRPLSKPRPTRRAKRASFQQK